MDQPTRSRRIRRVVGGLALAVAWAAFSISLRGPAVVVEPDPSGWFNIFNIPNPAPVWVMWILELLALHPYFWILTLSFLLTPVSVFRGRRGIRGAILRSFHWSLPTLWLLAAYRAPSFSGPLPPPDVKWGFYLCATALTLAWFAVLIAPKRDPKPPKPTKPGRPGFEVVFSHHTE